MLTSILRALVSSWWGGSTKNESDSSQLDSLNHDCKLRILSFFTSDDLNSFAICNRECRRLRADESLDQTRTATITWTENTTINSFCQMFFKYRHAFTGNTTQVKIVGLERDHNFTPTTLRRFHTMPIKEIASLDCSFESFSTPGNSCIPEVLDILYCNFPNVKKLDLSNMPREPRIMRTLTRWKGFLSGRGSHALSHIIWKNCDSLFFSGSDFMKVKRLTRLDLDGSTLSRILTARRTEDPFDYLFVQCSHLEQLSIKRVKLLVAGEEAIPMPQDEIVKMVRKHPTLRWFRSDLTAENVEILKRERPDMTFVSI